MSKLRLDPDSFQVTSFPTGEDAGAGPAALQAIGPAYLEPVNPNTGTSSYDGGASCGASCYWICKASEVC